MVFKWFTIRFIGGHVDENVFDEKKIDYFLVIRAVLR